MRRIESTLGAFSIETGSESKHSAPSCPPLWAAIVDGYPNLVIKLPPEILEPSLDLGVCVRSPSRSATRMPQTSSRLVDADALSNNSHGLSYIALPT